MSNNTKINRSYTPRFHAISSKLAHFKYYWQQLNPRDRRIWLLVIIALTLCLLWLMAIAPAMKTLRHAPDLHRQLDAQIESMQRISTEAKSLQKQPKLSLEDAQIALQKAITQRIGSNGQINITGNRAVLTFKNVTPQTVAEFLTDARINAHAIPQEAKIVRNNTPITSWDGSMTLTLAAK